VVFVRTDHAGGSAFDPSGDVDAGLNASGVVGDDSDVVVEREPGDRSAPVSDRAQHERGVEVVDPAGGNGASATHGVAADSDAAHLRVTDDLDRGAEEPENDSPIAPRGVRAETPRRSASLSRSA